MRDADAELVEQLGDAMLAVVKHYIIRHHVTADVLLAAVTELMAIAGRNTSKASGEPYDMIINAMAEVAIEYPADYFDDDEFQTVTKQ